MFCLSGTELTLNFILTQELILNVIYIYLRTGHQLNSYSKQTGGSISLESWGVRPFCKKQRNAQSLSNNLESILTLSVTLYKSSLLPRALAIVVFSVPFID